MNFAKMSPKEASIAEYATQKAFELHYEWSNLYFKTGIRRVKLFASIV